MIAIDHELVYRKNLKNQVNVNFKFKEIIVAYPLERYYYIVYHLPKKPKMADETKSSAKIQLFTSKIDHCHDRNRLQEKTQNHEKSLRYPSN